MNADSIGTIRDIYRFPVKSMAGERLPEARIEMSGLYGDRCCAFVDPGKEGWDRYVTARNVPALLSYRAALSEEQRAGQEPAITITAPDGRVCGWDASLLDRIAGLAGRGFTLERFPAFGEELLAVDSAPLLLVTDASLRKLGEMNGKELDSRRFRANLIISLQDDEPFTELSWIGKRFSVGDVLLEIVEPCERCMMITLDPDSLERDSAVLRTVASGLNGCFGVYAKVVIPGTVRAGDKVGLFEVGA